jgi:hypothetical protein
MASMIAATAPFNIATLVRDYGDIAGEVAACRNAAALFDFSFMHCARIAGPDALFLVQRLTPRPFGDLAPVASATRLPTSLPFPCTRRSSASRALRSVPPRRTGFASPAFGLSPIPRRSWPGRPAMRRFRRLPGRFS